MGLSTAQLEAFMEVAKAGSFSKAAGLLHITQSALSQRILNLESELGSSLLIRDPAGLRLTPVGDELLRYCRAKESLEHELIGKITKTKGVSGTIRIAGFSSIMRSVVLPLVGEFAAEHPDLRIELFCREMRELWPLLSRSEVDFVLTSVETQKQDVESLVVGIEENVLVQPRDIDFRNVYLDHDAEDETTLKFLGMQSKKPGRIERNYFDEVYSIIDAVALGLGQAVLPKHLVKHDRRLKIVKGPTPLRTEIYLQSYKQPFYTKLHQRVKSLLMSKIASKLI